MVILTAEDPLSALLHFQKLCLLETPVGIFPSNPIQGGFSQPTHSHPTGQRLGPNQESTPLLPPLPRGRDGTANQLSTFEKDLQ